MWQFREKINPHSPTPCVFNSYKTSVHLSKNLFSVLCLEGFCTLRYTFCFMKILRKRKKRFTTTGLPFFGFDWFYSTIVEINFEKWLFFFKLKKQEKVHLLKIKYLFKKWSKPQGLNVQGEGLGGFTLMPFPEEGIPLLVVFIKMFFSGECPVFILAQTLIYVHLWPKLFFRYNRTCYFDLIKLFYFWGCCKLVNITEHTILDVSASPWKVEFKLVWKN